MDVFYGNYILNIDSTGRFVLPADLRKSFGSSCIITKGIGCLWLMTPTYFENIKAQITGKTSGPLEAMFNANISTISRHIFSGMSIVYPDKDRNCRITLNQTQRLYADISNTIELCGVGDYVEIWCPENLDIRNKKLDDDLLFEIGNSLFNPPVEKNELS